MRARLKALTRGRKDALLLAYQTAQLTGYRTRMPRWDRVLAAWFPDTVRAARPVMTTDQIEAFFDGLVARG